MLHIACSTGISQPFYRDTTLQYYYYTKGVRTRSTLLSTYSCPVNRLHISARAPAYTRARAFVRARWRSFARLFQMVRKKLDEGATESPLLIIHLLIQYLLLLQTMIPNSQLIFLPSAKRGLRKN